MNSYPSIVPSFFKLTETESTNQYCKERSSLLPNGAVVYTFSQTGGRGSKGRIWTCAPSKGLALSVLIRNIPAAALSPLPLVMGLSAAETLQKSGFPVMLKWPNDLLLYGKKVSGLLCEGEWQGENGNVVCGIGLNLLQSAEELLQANLPFAGSLFSLTGNILPVNDWIPTFASRFLKDYQTLCSKGFAPFYQAYCERCVTLGKTVRIRRDGTTKTGKAVSIAPDGRLVCQSEETTFLIHQSDPALLNLYPELK